MVRELKDALKGADQLLLATDEDREGESISWHLLQLLAPKVPVKRMVFHEITKEAIGKALDQTRDLDMELVHAQETRRILDRLVGYTLSPLLWKKVAWGLSAGRVQSVAVRLLVQRERARRAFRSGSYWDLKAKLEQSGSAFEAKLTHVGGQRIATGNDFDESTGGLKAGSAVRLLSESEAKALAETVRSNAWTVDAVEEKPTVRKPVPPSPRALFNRRPIANCGFQRGKPCAVPRASTNGASSLTCAPTRCICLIKRSMHRAAVLRAFTARSI